MTTAPKKEALHFTPRPIERVPGAHFGGVGDMVGKRIEAGDLVYLLDGKCTIAVAVTKRNGASFEGTIHHFEPYDVEFFKGHQPGDSVRFVYSEIHESLPNNE